jgi:uncharacterized protein YndB with AHSA1/START domain
MENIKHSWELKHAPETVWEALTDASQLSQWLMPNDIKAVKGHHFMFRTSEICSLEFDGNIYCEVLEAVPAKKLSYTWQHGPRKGELNVDTVVHWTLKPTATGTELTLEHAGFDSRVMVDMYNALNGGWAKNGQTLAKLLDEKVTA